VSNPGLLRKLAEESGGVAFFPRNDAGVIEAFTEIASNIRRGYSLGYTPTNTTRDGRYRRIKVLVRVPGRSNNLKVNARDGYFAPRDSDAD
jgi:VWFA-related protein